MLAFGQVQVFEFKHLFGLGEHQQLAGQDFAAIAGEQADLYGNHKRLFVGLTGRGGAALAQGEAEAALRGVPLATRLHARCAGLGIPAFELRQVLRQGRAGVGVCNGLGEVVTGHGLAVVALKVQRHAFGKTCAARCHAAVADQGLHHAHKL